MPAADRASTQLQPVDRHPARAPPARAAPGSLIGTRPGVNVMLARLQVPGLAAIGLEQMNLGKHTRSVRRAIRAPLPELDALVVLTEQDREAYRELFDGALAAAPHPEHRAAARRAPVPTWAPRPSTRPGASATRRASTC